MDHARQRLIEKAQAFQSLHQAPGIFVTPNPWDAGSAKLLEMFGYKALATTSAGLAFSLGKADGNLSITREQTLANAQSIADATALPVSADLENGYGHDPEDCAATILLAGQAGLAGGSIEDATGNPAQPIYPFQLAVKRVKAAVAAARSLPVPFTLTARAENLIYDRPDLKDTIKRLVAFADAGADVLFAPGLKTREEVQAVVKAVAPRPVSVLMGITGSSLTLDELGEIGVKRVSLGSALIRAAYGELLRAAAEVREKGTFTFANHAQTYGSLNERFAR